VAITETALDKENPLLIVNGRVNLIESDHPVRRIGPPAIQDANMIVANYANQRA